MNGVTALLEGVIEAFKEVELPQEWRIESSDDRALSDGYLFLRRNMVITACIVDYHRQMRAATLGKGPITLEKYTNNWELVCDADTPEQVVQAFLTYDTFGAFNDL